MYVAHKGQSSHLWLLQKLLALALECLRRVLAQETAAVSLSCGGTWQVSHSNAGRYQVSPEAHVAPGLRTFMGGEGQRENGVPQFSFQMSILNRPYERGSEKIPPENESSKRGFCFLNCFSCEATLE